MAGRPPARFTERTTENVLQCLRNHFREDLAFTYETAIAVIISDFACQRPTATQLLDTTYEDGELYLLYLTDGALYKAEIDGQAPIEFESFPALVDTPRYRRGLSVADKRVPGNARTRAETALALPQVFEPWAKAHQEEVAAEKAEQEAERQAEKAAARAAFPALAPVAEFGQRWKEVADAKQKWPPVSVSLFEVRGKPMMTLDLRGAALERMGPELLALLEKYCPLPEAPTPE